MSYARVASGIDAGGNDDARADAPERDLAGALHEVSNSLTVILGWLEAARDAAGDNEQARQAIDVAWSRARLGRDLARRAIGADPGEADEDRTAGALVRDAVVGVEHEAARRALTVQVDAERRAQDRHLRAAPAALQILTNLLLNAVAMSPEGSTVTVEASANEDDVIFAVADEGPGVEPSRRETVFEGGPSSRPGGAGIGLRHAHALAASKGGELRLVPSARGARFELRWPLTDVVPPPSRSGRASTSLEGMRVLVLEDDDAVLDLLSTALSIRGAHVYCARSMRELVDATAGDSYDAALLDLSPIAADLTTALGNVRAHSPKAKLVLISGSAAGVPDDAAALTSAWVRKPFEVGEIVTVLGQLLPRAGR